MPLHPQRSFPTVTGLKAVESDTEPNMAPDALEAFLRDLDAVSRRHGVALTDGAILYLMEQRTMPAPKRQTRAT